MDCCLYVIVDQCFIRKYVWSALKTASVLNVGKMLGMSSLKSSDIEEVSR